MAGSPSRSRRIPVSVSRISWSVTRASLRRMWVARRGVRREGKRPAPARPCAARSRAAGRGPRSRRSARSARRRARISATPRARAASTRMFSASSSSWRPNTRQLITQLTSSSDRLRLVPAFILGRLEQHDADDAVVAELVEQAELQRQRLRVGGERRHLRLGAADRRGVELVGLVDELGDAGEVQRVRPGRTRPSWRAARGTPPCRRRRSPGSRARGSPRTARRGPGRRR